MRTLGDRTKPVGDREPPIIGAGWLENTDEHLARWVQNPEQYKQGTMMKVTPITDAEAQALVAFLRTRQ